MKNINIVSGLVISSSFLFTSAFANEQPKAQDLVGKAYVGAHLLHMNTDNERLITTNPLSNIDHGSGFGFELGYRMTESTEFRLSYSELNLVNENIGFDVPNSSSTAAEILIFPTQQNFYVVGGLDFLDIVDTEASVDLGLGYRHYLSERSAVYFEAKAHYQLLDYYTDTSAKIGFVYFFGESTKPRRTKSVQPVSQKETPVAVTSPVPAPVAIVENDTDKDGVLDNKDNCPNTPMTDKVDHNGCTIFSDEKVSMNLLVNFDNNSSIVNAEYLDEIKAVADFLTLYPHTSLIIEGHTSKVGSSDYNQRISQKRAQSIVNVLVNKFSIKASRLVAMGYGEDRLINTADNMAAHKENRRIKAEIEVTQKVATKR
jgi:OOP family OmpA-OmpF porin